MKRSTSACVNRRGGQLHDPDLGGASCSVIAHPPLRNTQLGRYLPRSQQTPGGRGYLRNSNAGALLLIALSNPIDRLPRIIRWFVHSGLLAPAICGPPSCLQDSFRSSITSFIASLDSLIPLSSRSADQCREQFRSRAFFVESMSYSPKSPSSRDPNTLATIRPRNIGPESLSP